MKKIMFVAQIKLIMESIEKFVRHFKHQMELVDSIGQTGIYKTHKKILYVAFIDVLSGVVYPKKNNRDRFVETILNFGGWDHVERVSLPTLANFLKMNPDPNFTELMVRVSDLIGQWSLADHITLDRDPEFSSLESYWPESKNREKKKRNLKCFQHGQLLYDARNFLVHGFRLPADVFDMPEDNDLEPYYLSCLGPYAEIPSQDRWCWALIYPILFLKRLSERILNNVEIHFKKEKIDPIEIIVSEKH